MMISYGYGSFLNNIYFPEHEGLNRIVEIPERHVQTVESRERNRQKMKNKLQMSTRESLRTPKNVIPVQVLSPTPDKLPTALVIPNFEKSKLSEDSKLMFGFESPQDLTFNQASRGKHVPDTVMTDSKSVIDINAHSKSEMNTETYSDLARLKMQYSTPATVPKEMDSIKETDPSSKKMLWIIGAVLVFSYFYMNR